MRIVFWVLAAAAIGALIVVAMADNIGQMTGR